jgi:hypothetical protein
LHEAAAADDDTTIVYNALDPPSRFLFNILRSQQSETALVRRRHQRFGGDMGGGLVERGGEP